MTIRVDSGSFRDPSGFVFRQNGIVYRQVNRCYREEYDFLKSSGLYDELTAANLMVSHEDAAVAGLGDEAYKVLKPVQVPFISYPYEWCFSQLKDAALLTLDIQKRALASGMSLKDASAFNVQFVNGRPCFIDTLSFERYREGEPWVAYRQFCMQFLAPLALMSYRDIRFGKWFRVAVDGVPLDLVSSLLPFRSRFNVQLFMHIFMHARSEKRYADRTIGNGQRGEKMGKFALTALIDSLEGAVRRLNWRAEGTEWADYYQGTNYSDESLERKKALVAEYVGLSGAKTVWDLGANDGTFSRIASSMGIDTVSFDIDPVCVEKNYLAVKSGDEKCLLPLVQDLTNPSPGLGWNNSERSSLVSRGPCDTALSLALIHHLAVSNNVPLPLIAEHYAGLCAWLVIEFVPKDDSQVQRLLATRKDIFDRYNQENFEASFGQHFEIVRKAPIAGSCRILYLMKNIRPVGSV